VKQEKFQPQGTFFLLTSTFIEQIGTWRVKADKIIILQTASGP